jgi:RNA polymerase sigma-70 factor (ECF subfamily)
MPENETTGLQPADLPSTQAVSQPDEVLARRAHLEKDAFNELYHRYQSKVYRYHIARTGNDADAQDLTSQTFLAALEHVGAYTGRGSFASWLFGIAWHKLGDHFRQRGNYLPLEEALQIPDHSNPPEQAAQVSLQLGQVTQALLTLTEERAQAVTLRFFANLTPSEIGEVMGKSPAAVKMLVHRGLNDLQILLSQNLENEND